VKEKTKYKDQGVKRGGAPITMNRAAAVIWRKDCRRAVLGIKNASLIVIVNTAAITRRGQEAVTTRESR